MYLKILVGCEVRVTWFHIILDGMQQWISGLKANTVKELGVTKTDLLVSVHSQVTCHKHVAGRFSIFSLCRNVYFPKAVLKHTHVHLFFLFMNIFFTVNPTLWSFLRFFLLNPGTTIMPAHSRHSNTFRQRICFCPMNVFVLNRIWIWSSYRQYIYSDNNPSP